MSPDLIAEIDMVVRSARDRAGVFNDFPPMLQEFVRQFREFTNIRFEAREKRFISALFPQAFESRHT